MVKLEASVSSRSRARLGPTVLVMDLANIGPPPAGPDEERIIPLRKCLGVGGGGGGREGGRQWREG
eukprot:6409619-Alexandrium_andersonii.AAC.1